MTFYTVTGIASQPRLFRDDCACGSQTALLRDFVSARIVINQMRRLHEDRSAASLAFVVMSDHVHWMFQLGGPLQLAAIVKRFKARSAHGRNRHLNRRGALWRRDYYDHAIRAKEEFREVTRYIIANPLRAGLACEVDSYSHRDAAWL